MLSNEEIREIVNAEIENVTVEEMVTFLAVAKAIEKRLSVKHCFAVYRNIPHEGSFVTKLFATEQAAKNWIEAGRAFQEANPMPERPEWNLEAESAKCYLESSEYLDHIAKTEELNAANSGRYLDEGETFFIKQLEINQ